MYFDAKFLTPVRASLTPLSEHLSPIGLLAHERPRGKIVAYCDLTDLFGGTELIALDILAKREKKSGHRKNTDII